jgi:hypothetical protein
VIVATLAAAAMTMTGAFGTSAAPLVPRLAYWLIVMEAGALIGIGVNVGVRLWGRLTGKPWLEGALVSLLIALPLTLVVLVATTGFFGDRTFTLASIGWLFAMVLAVTAMITAINYATAPHALPPLAAADRVPESPVRQERPRFADRLPRHLREADLHALQAEDHYLRVHTAAGSDLILMRLGDAIPELDPIEGARTHRSWWVARAAVIAATRKDGRGELTLTGGVVAPVSRSAYPELRDKGWFS